MNFNKHSELEGKHAFLSASKYHWLNYDEDRLISSYQNQQAKIKGTLLHEFAHDAILHGIHLQDDGSTLSMYVNDCIDESLKPEVILYYSINAFGTADAIGFDGSLLKISDLKTGKTPANIKQLLIYAALFCLEYEINPCDISILLRLYQNGDILWYEPSHEEVWTVIDRIIGFDDILHTIQSGGYNV